MAIFLRLWQSGRSYIAWGWLGCQVRFVKGALIWVARQISSVRGFGGCVGGIVC